MDRLRRRVSGNADKSASPLVGAPSPEPSMGAPFVATPSGPPYVAAPRVVAPVSAPDATPGATPQATFEQSGAPEVSARAFFDMTASRLGAPPRTESVAKSLLHWEAPIPETAHSDSSPRFAHGFLTGCWSPYYCWPFRSALFTASRLAICGRRWHEKPRRNRNSKAKPFLHRHRPFQISPLACPRQPENPRRPQLCLPTQRSS